MTAAAQAAVAEADVCACCGKPAACFGAYEDATEPGFACNECCGHGNEDGWCEPVDQGAR